MNPHSMNPPKTVFAFLCRGFFLFCLSMLTACASLAQTGTAQAAAAPRPYTQAELDQMLAPVALYPDALLSQVLMAATYPLDVVEAAQWSRRHPELQGQQAAQAVNEDSRYQWDPSVMSLVAFPQLLARMEENISWTRSLGEAFVYQQGEVMDSVQRLRLRAMEQGNLRSSEQINVYPQGQIISIEPVNPQVIYVPYYNPNFVYGNWWWRSYPPMYWAPWPGYFSLNYTVPYTGASLVWSSGISIGLNFFFGIFDWRQHRVYIRPDHSPRHDPRRYQPYSSPRVGSVLIWRHHSHPAPRPAMPPHPSSTHGVRPGTRPLMQPYPSQPRHLAPPATPGRPSMQDERSERREVNERNERTNPPRERGEYGNPGDARNTHPRSANAAADVVDASGTRPFMLPASAPRTDTPRRNITPEPAPSTPPPAPTIAPAPEPEPARHTGNREIRQAEPAREAQSRSERNARDDSSGAAMQERGGSLLDRWNQGQGRSMRMDERGSRR